MKKFQRPICGWLALDKPSGLGSTPALGEVKRIFEAAKAGHAGTLDPLATGCLPIAFGDATKLIPYAQDGKKTYDFTLKWGESTTTDDSQGDLLESSEHRPSEADILAVLPEFTGEIMQVPPRFSAIKIDGARAYDLAREGEVFEIAARPVHFYEAALAELPDADHARFTVACGKGGYVRSLARDLAVRLGTLGHVTALRRLCVGPIDESMLISLDSLREMRHKGETFEMLDRFIQPPETVLDDIPALAIGEGEAASLRQGRAILLRGRDAPADLDDAWVSLKGKLLAIGDVEDGMFQPRKLFKPEKAAAAASWKRKVPDVDHS